MVQETVTERPKEPEVPRDESTSGSSFVIKDLVGGLGTIIMEAAQAYAELEASRALGERVQSFESKLVVTKSRISSLERELKEQERMHVMQRKRNLLLEHELRTSLKPKDISLERKYWDAVKMCS